MPNVKDMFPSKYVNALVLLSLPENKRQVRVTIKSIVSEEVFNPVTNKKGPKWVCYFNGQTKGLILSKTKIADLSSAWGPDTDKWIGKDAVLCLVQTSKGPGLMLRIQKTAEAPPRSEPGETEDDLAIDEASIPK